MNVELKYLVWVALLNAFMWLPYILNTIVTRGLIAAVGYQKDPKPLADWAVRLKAAHYNAVENLVVFATVVLTANAIGVSTETTATAAVVYFWARVVHAISYTFAVPWVRTLSFAVAWAATVLIAWQLL